VISGGGRDVGGAAVPEIGRTVGGVCLGWPLGSIVVGGGVDEGAAPAGAVNRPGGAASAGLSSTSSSASERCRGRLRGLLKHTLPSLLAVVLVC